MGASNGSMTTMGQTLREARRPTNSTVTPKNTLVMSCDGTLECAQLVQDGNHRGKETEAGPKQYGVALWRRKETDTDGTHGQEEDRQQTTASSEGKMFWPCAPLGSKRFNFNSTNLLAFHNAKGTDHYFLEKGRV